MTRRRFILLIILLITCVAGISWQSFFVLPSQSNIINDKAMPKLGTSKSAETLESIQSTEIPSNYLIVAPSGILFDTTNLFSVYQLALYSNDLPTIERGLKAWHSCVGYVASGEGDLEDWLNFVMPEGLTKEEFDKRAKFARSSALRCAGFVSQSDQIVMIDDLMQRARDLGSVSEKLYFEIFNSKADKAIKERNIAELSCAVIQQYPTNPSGIRYISIAMKFAAKMRPSHLLNSQQEPARAIAVNLAFCDLDKEGCNAHSGFVGSACMQSGECSFSREEEYWKAITEAKTYSLANSLRQDIVTMVKQRNCEALFH